MDVSKMKEIAVKICNDEELEGIYPSNFSVWLGHPEAKGEGFIACFDDGAYHSRAERCAEIADDLMLQDRMAFGDKTMLTVSEYTLPLSRTSTCLVICGLTQSSDGSKVYCVRFDERNSPNDTVLIRINGVAEEKFSLVDIEKAVLKAFARAM